MSLLDALITVLSHPFGWFLTFVVGYMLYACVRVAWDVLRAFTTFD